MDASDGAEELCKKASALTGIPVKCMLFQELEAVGVYDGIWACASILHLPQKELADVLCKIAVALKKNGVLYTSFKYGSFEGMRNGRYFTDFTEDSLLDAYLGEQHFSAIPIGMRADIGSNGKFTAYYFTKPTEEAKILTDCVSNVVSLVISGSNNLLYLFINKLILSSSL